MAALALRTLRWPFRAHLKLSASPATPEPIRLRVLGCLVAEQAERPIEDWGGPKAGRRQALAMFAFLFDRGGSGVDRDEVIELIWPENDYASAELAFHRTLGGLRRAIAQGWEKRAIAFHNDRYRLHPSLVGWTDVGEFVRLCAAPEADHELEIHWCERARTLYRGDYLDDCPYYGTSAEVETRRQALRCAASGVLTRLADLYAIRGTLGLAALRRAEASRLME